MTICWTYRSVFAADQLIDDRFFLAFDVDFQKIDLFAI